MSRPTIDEVIRELTPKNRLRLRLIIIIGLMSMIIGVGISYKLLTKEKIDPIPLISEAKMLIASNRIDEAIPKLELAYEHGGGPETGELLASCYDRSGKVQEAIQWASRAADIAPQNPSIHEKLAVLFEKAGSRKEAISHWEKVIELQPENEYAKLRLKRLIDEK